MGKKIIAIQTQNPHLAAYPCLCQVLSGGKYDDDEIIAGFEKFVPKNDYFRGDAEELLQYLLRWSVDRDN